MSDPKPASSNPAEYVCRICNEHEPAERSPLRGPRDVCSGCRQKVADASINYDNPSPPATAKPGATFADGRSLIARITWAWPQWLPRGYVTVLGGLPEAGKSLLALTVAGNLLNGEPLPDGAASSRIESVLWVDTEGSQGLTIDRAYVLGLPLERFSFATDDPLRSIKLDNPAEWKVFVNVVATKQPGLVVIDSLRGSYRGEEKDSGATSELLSNLQSIATKHQIPILVIHHLTKPDPRMVNRKPDLQNLRGSGAIGAVARVTWEAQANVHPHPEFGWVSVLTCTKSNILQRPDPIAYRCVIGEGITWLGPAIPEEEKRGLEKALAFLREIFKPGVSRQASDVVSDAKAAGICQTTLERAKGVLEIRSVKQRGTSNGPWLWSRTDAVEERGG